MKGGGKMNFDFLSAIDLHPAIVSFVPVLIIIGFALKKTPKVQDWTIVWAVLVLGAIGGLLAIGLTIEGFANGVIAGGLAVATHQAYSQTKHNI
jgi:hypothetical protein